MDNAEWTNSVSRPMPDDLVTGDQADARIRFGDVLVNGSAELVEARAPTTPSLVPAHGLPTVSVPASGCSPRQRRQHA